MADANNEGYVALVALTSDRSTVQVYRRCDLVRTVFQI